MRNFFYLQSYNMGSSAIRSMLADLGMTGIHDSLADLRVRSKYFLSNSETLQHATDDFEKKLTKIFPAQEGVSKGVELGAVKVVTLMNPKFALKQLTEPHPFLADQKWDDNCTATMFFCETTGQDLKEKDMPRTWMMKYEIFFEEDTIQLVDKNGTHAFDPATWAYHSFSSAVH